MERKIYISVTAIFLGLFVTTQSRSFDELSSEFLRNSKSNVFQEINILKIKNEDLRKEVEELTANLAQLDDQNLGLDSIEKEIIKYEKLVGNSPIYGSGVTVTVHGDITTPWIIDVVNAFFNAGAEAVSVNGIRLTNATVGFDTLPQGQILLNGSILSPPYVFNVIGEPEVALNILELPGGIFDRLEAAFEGLYIEATVKEIISME